MKWATLFLASSLAWVSPAFAKPQTFNIDAKKSNLEWTGSKVIGDKHVGTLAVKKGSVTFDGATPVKAVVVVDMTSIKNSDVSDPKWNAKLVNHLKSDDFFSVDKHPEAKLVINSFEKKGNTYQLKGDLHIKGKKKPVELSAVESEVKGSRHIKASLKFDRTDFDVRYGSGKFFENLGDKMISDDITLEATIQLEAKAQTASR